MISWGQWVAKSRSFPAMLRLADVYSSTAWNLGTWLFFMEHFEVFLAIKKEKSACASSSLSAPISHNFTQNHLEHIGQEALNCPLLNDSCQHYFIVELKCRSPSGAYFVKAQDFIIGLSNWKTNCMKRERSLCCPGNNSSESADSNVRQWASFFLVVHSANLHIHSELCSHCQLQQCSSSTPFLTAKSYFWGLCLLVCGHMSNGYLDVDAYMEIKPENFHRWLTFLTFLPIRFSCSFLEISWPYKHWSF